VSRTALPLETIRDLLGVPPRALYRSAAAAAANGGDGRPLEALTEIAEDLRAAQALARQAGPDTMGHRAAWKACPLPRTGGPASASKMTLTHCPSGA
jgi:hypothetical protein